MLDEIINQLAQYLSDGTLDLMGDYIKPLIDDVGSLGLDADTSQGGGTPGHTIIQDPGDVDPATPGGGGGDIVR